jgi:hypothetical protein
VKFFFLVGVYATENFCKMNNVYETKPLIKKKVGKKKILFLGGMGNETFRICYTTLCHSDLFQLLQLHCCTIEKKITVLAT